MSSGSAPIRGISPLHYDTFVVAIDDRLEERFSVLVDVVDDLQA
jgi:hypothetical protein